MIEHNFIGVGGLVCYQEQYLLVRQAYGEYMGLWILPGGHVKPGEAIHGAIEREVMEESNVKAKSAGIVAARSRIRSPGVTDCYLVFKMTYLEGIPRPDDKETTDAQFFYFDEIERRKNVVNLTRIIIEQHRTGNLQMLARNDSFEFYNSNRLDFQLFL